MSRIFVALLVAWAGSIDTVARADVAIYTQGYAASDKNTFLAAGWTLGTALWFTVFTDGNPAGGHIYAAAHLAQDWTNLCHAAVVPCVPPSTLRAASISSQ